MEAFQLLSRGGARFNKIRFQSDVKLFNKNLVTRQGSFDVANQGDDIPTELDFFRYAEGGHAKRKVDLSNNVGRRIKRRKTYDEDDGYNVIDSDSEPERPRQSHRVVAKGNNVPKRIEAFEELGQRYSMSKLLLTNLKKCNYTQPTAIQSHGVPILIQNRDLAAISPTGTGKTLSYLLPIFVSLKAPSSSEEREFGRGVRALIICPTKELAHQIYNECLKLAQGRKWKIVLFSKAAASTLSNKIVRDRIDMIISTPLRLVASLQSGTIELDNVRHLILDEADRLLDAEFLPQVQEIVAACTHAAVQKAVFSATLPAGVEKLAMNMLRDPIRVVVGLKDTPLPLIAQTLTYVADDQSKLPSLLSYLAKPYNPPLLIFTSTQPRAASLVEELILNRIRNVDCLHAGMSNKERGEALSRMRNGESWIMVTTEVMARGMDFKGVREVISYDFPTSVQSYVHRIGRTGRAGREGKATTYFTDEDGPYLKPIANVLLQSGSMVPDWMLKLPKPSRMKKKTMGKINRPKLVNTARLVGRRDTIKKRSVPMAVSDIYQ
ncbi:hypothetical protein AMATHDRAFT_135053 [Amanita thiersii Skay4041]|uniref:RNA helicase n=1 Tax=Amanita thiersii Skay4041 TaxID=703135 RepID=A0A2A9NVY3_9AGAR|nr:hypothetical protein AMATHDRAFT_135053 [Amanita thiersii Skay4041]